MTKMAWDQHAKLFQAVIRTSKKTWFIFSSAQASFLCLCVQQQRREKHWEDVGKYHSKTANTDRWAQRR